MQVWIPMNKGGRWRLVCVDLVQKTMRTYDPFVAPDVPADKPSHILVLERALASESTEWAHQYEEYHEAPLSMNLTGVLLLQSLERKLLNTEDLIKEVCPSTPLLLCLARQSTRDVEAPLCYR